MKEHIGGEGGTTAPQEPARRFQDLLLAAFLVLLGLLAAGATITLSGGDHLANAQQYQPGGGTTNTQYQPGGGTTGIETPDPLESGQGVISGRVLDDNETSLGGAPVYVCRISDYRCKTTQTDAASGAYTFSNLPDAEYTVTAYPPSGSSARPAQIGPLALSGGQTLAGRDIVLVLPKPIPEDTTITSLYETQDGVPVVYPSAELTLTTQGCAGGAASYQVLRDGQVFRSGEMAEGPTGTYTTTVEPLGYGGPARFEITVDCPEGSDETTAFDVYIDPSGNVRTVEGDPIEGAKVTLYRSGTATGPFEAVPDGSAIMSPMNRTNPDATDAEGHFGWDVIAGFYKVRAEKEGCHAPNSSQTFVESHVMTIPPPVTDLDLRLDCGPRYDFEGFFKPVDNTDVATNEAKAGSSIPVKFSLGGDKGLSIFEQGYPKSQQIDNPSVRVDGIEPTVTAGSSGLSYDPATGRYTYVWKTDKAWAGTHRQLVLKFGDHTTVKRANFYFTR